MNSCFIALRFVKRPDLHATLAYYKPAIIEELTAKLETTFKESVPSFILTFNKPVRYGAKNDIPALLCEQVVPLAIQQLCPTGKLLHVTCNDPPGLVLRVSSVALMHKKEILREWFLEKDQLHAPVGKQGVFWSNELE